MLSDNLYAPVIRTQSGAGCGAKAGPILPKNPHVVDGTNYLDHETDARVNKFITDMEEKFTGILTNLFAGEFEKLSLVINIQKTALENLISEIIVLKTRIIDLEQAIVINDNKTESETDSKEDDAHSRCSCDDDG